MKYKIAVQMDPIDAIDITGDTSFALALEAQHRGCSLWYYHPDDLYLEGSDIKAICQTMSLLDVKGDHVRLGPREERALNDMDIILMRQDPPFDMAYITATHLLEMLPAHTMVINNPHAVRNAPEKLLVTLFSELMPPTLISRNSDVIQRFRSQHKDIIIKPLYGNGGAGVFRLQPDDQNVNALLEMFFASNHEPVMVQAFLPDVVNGDKRIILINGEPVGAINRVPQEGEARSNMHVGGRAEAVELSARDREICAVIGPELRKRSLIFVGIDVIGGYLTEINVTSPTGIREMTRFTRQNLAASFWDAVDELRPSYSGNGPLRRTS
ncbi:glutathione synthase [Alphaproteobacteria bacterium]|nr:glutathione synthase [Alphaproteobacteria bacterium]